MAESIEDFAARVTGHLNDGDLDAFVGSTKAVNVPPNWVEMVSPMLLDLRGRGLKGVVRARSEFTNEELFWPEETPELLKDVEWILRVEYAGDGESGSQTMPITNDGGEWKILIGE